MRPPQASVGAPRRRPRCADGPDTAPDIRHALLAPALRAALVATCASLALAGCASCGLRLRLGPVHSVRRRCRLRRAPACAPRPALVPARVPTLPPPPPAACCARLPAAPSAPRATQSPWRLPSAGIAGVDSPFALPRIPGCFYALRRLVLTPDSPEGEARQVCAYVPSHGKFVLIVGVESCASSTRRRAFIAALSHVRRRISP